MRRLGQSVILVLVVASLAGCFRPTIVSWGDDKEGGEFMLEWDQSVSLSITEDGSLNGTPDGSIKLSSKHTSDAEVLSAVGCDFSGNIVPARIDGWLTATKHFPLGPASAGAPTARASSPTSVMMDPSFTFEGALDRDVANVGKVNIMDWSDPGRAQVQTSADGDGSNQLILVSLIPADEKILDGFRALTWHQAVLFEGYAIGSQADSSPSSKVSDATMTAGGMPLYECPRDNGGGYEMLPDPAVLGSVTADKQSASKQSMDGIVFMVTKIETGNSHVITQEGVKGSTYKHGTVGTTGPFLYLIILGIIAGGGGFGTFILSKMILAKQTNAMTKEMIQAEKLAQVSGVRDAMKKAKKEGRNPVKEAKAAAKEREQKVRDAEKAAEDLAAKRAKETKPSFDIDSILSVGGADESMPDGIVAGGGVVATEAALDQDESIAARLEAEGHGISSQVSAMVGDIDVGGAVTGRVSSPPVGPTGGVTSVSTSTESPSPSPRSSISGSLAPERSEAPLRQAGPPSDQQRGAPPRGQQRAGPPGGKRRSPPPGSGGERQQRSGPPVGRRTPPGGGEGVGQQSSGPVSSHKSPEPRSRGKPSVSDDNFDDFSL